MRRDAYRIGLSYGDAHPYFYMFQKGGVSYLSRWLRLKISPIYAAINLFWTFKGHSHYNNNYNITYYDNYIGVYTTGR